MNSYSGFNCFNIHELIYAMICETICDSEFLGTDCVRTRKVLNKFNMWFGVHDVVLSLIGLTEEDLAG